MLPHRTLLSTRITHVQTCGFVGGARGLLNPTFLMGAYPSCYPAHNTTLHSTCTINHLEQIHHLGLKEWMSRTCDFLLSAPLGQCTVNKTKLYRVLF